VQISLEKFLERILLLGYLVLIGGPLLALGWVLLTAPVTNPYGVALPPIFSLRKATLLLNSLLLAGSVTLVGMSIALLAASAAAAQSNLWQRVFRWLLIATVVLPPYVHALTWMTVFDRLNTILLSLGLADLHFHGWVASAWVQLIAFLPLAVLISQAGFRRVEEQLVAAARTQRADLQVFWRVVLPLAGPLVVVGCGFLFLLSLMDYSIPYLFGKNVYTLEIFADFSAHNQPGRALLVAFPLVGMALLIIMVSFAGVRSLVVPSQGEDRLWSAGMSLPKWFHFLQSFSIMFLVIAALAPLIMLWSLVGSLPDLIVTLKNGTPETLFTLTTSLLTGLICLPFALAASRVLTIPDRRSLVLWLITFIVLAIPPSLVGIGQVVLWNRSLFGGLYGTDAMVVLTNLSLFMPLAAIVLTGQQRRTDQLLVDATRLFQKNTIHGWWKVHLPLLAPGLLAAACLVMILSAGELAAILIVVPPGRATLTLRIYNFIHYGSPEAVAGLSLALVILVMVTSPLMAFLLER
jgi:iron(III) transport system permease protein